MNYMGFFYKLGEIGIILGFIFDVLTWALLIKYVFFHHTPKVKYPTREYRKVIQGAYSDFFRKSNLTTFHRVMNRALDLCNFIGDVTPENFYSIFKKLLKEENEQIYEEFMEFMKSRQDKTKP